LLDLNEITIRFGSRTLFENLNWHVAPGEKVGMVGDNGAGKSTLLKIIDGQTAPEQGRISMPSGFRTGYLPQGGIEATGRTLHEEALAAFGNVNILRDELEDLRFRLENSCDAEPELLNRYADIEQQLQAFDADRVEPRINAILSGLGFQKTDFERPLAEFSGGWQMRAALARLLLSSPDIMLLDEPTNYLDIEARMWLIEFLRDCRRMVIMVCHDRYFLDQTVQRISELENGRLEDYRCDYSGFVDEKKRRIKIMEATRSRQERELARQKRFIERFRSKARKASQVQSRIKKLADFELLEVPSSTGAIHVVIPTPERSGLVALSLKNAAAGYGGKPVIEEIDFEVRRGDRAALVGPNGAGKTTLMAVLAGRKELDEGKFKTGHNVTTGYFEQESARSLDDTLDVFETAHASAPAEFRPQLRSLLGAFGFSDDNVYKKVEVLSGGERSRLAILTLILTRPNVLLLDEPTNHLDIKTKDVLLAALKSFDGTVVFVSHDRYFMNALATRVVEIGEGKIKDYPGDYEHYLWRKRDSLNTSPQDSSRKVERKENASGAKEKWLKRKEISAEKRKLRKKINRLHESIEKMEKEISDTEAEMEKLYEAGNHHKASELAKKHEGLNSLLKEKLAEWENMETKLMELEEG